MAYQQRYTCLLYTSALDLLKEGKQICIIKEYSLEDGLSVMELLTEDLAAVVEQDAPETSKKSGGV